MLIASNSEYINYQTIYAIGADDKRLGQYYRFPAAYVHLDRDHKQGIYFVNNNNPLSTEPVQSGEALYVCNVSLAMLAINRDLAGWAFWGPGYPVAGAALMTITTSTGGKIRLGQGFNIRHFNRTPGDGLAVNKGSWRGYCYFTGTSSEWLSLVAADPATLPELGPPMPAAGPNV